MEMSLAGCTGVRGWVWMMKWCFLLLRIKRATRSAGLRSHPCWRDEKDAKSHLQHFKYVPWSSCGAKAAMFSLKSHRGDAYKVCYSDTHFTQDRRDVSTRLTDSLVRIVILTMTPSRFEASQARMILQHGGCTPERLRTKDVFGDARRHQSLGYGAGNRGTGTAS